MHEQNHICMFGCKHRILIFPIGIYMTYKTMIYCENAFPPMPGVSDATKMVMKGAVSHLILVLRSHEQQVLLTAEQSLWPHSLLSKHCNNTHQKDLHRVRTAMTTGQRFSEKDTVIPSWQGCKWHKLSSGQLRQQARESVHMF